MTNKIARRQSSFLRRAAMSPNSIFALVEGRNLDRRFYDAVMAAHPEAGKRTRMIWAIEQIADENGVPLGGGKKSVIKLHDYAKPNFGKINSSGGLLLFFVDRDNDHISGGLRRSPYLIYTEMCDVEAEAFTKGDDLESLKACLSLDEATARQIAIGIQGWQVDLANLWRQWIELCCLSKRLNARCGIGFGRESSINVPKYGAVDFAKLASARQEVLAAASNGATPQDEQIVARRIDSLYRKAKHTSIVKGKWLPFFLLDKIKADAVKASASLKGFEGVVAKFYLETAIKQSGSFAYYHARIDLALAHKVVSGSA